MFEKVKFGETGHLPKWRQPIVLLFLMAAILPIVFSTWMTLLNNFVKDAAQFDGADIGLLHTVREIPGFLSFAAIFLLLVMREQVLLLTSMMLLGAATAFYGWNPTFSTILVLTFVSSVGFHYYETANQSLQLQWLDKKRAPQMLGWITSAAAASTAVIYIIIFLGWERLNLDYNLVFLATGGFATFMALLALLAFPQFESPTPQVRKMVLKRRYWLYYALQFMAGARRQIFVVFAAFMMVEKFDFEVYDIAWLFLINQAANMAFGPVIGRIVHKFGEQRTLLFEYFGLVVVFLAYGGLYFFTWGVVLAMVLYVVDHLLFSMALALKTYFQKIADPEDIAPTAAVAFTINHIAAVFLPFLLGLLWLYSPGAVFVTAAAMAGVSFALALLIPRHPQKGYETRLQGVGPVPAE